MFSNKEGSQLAARKRLVRYSQIVYAVILIMLIPAIIVANTLYVIQRFRKNIDLQLQRQALLVSEVINATSISSQEDLSRMQEKLTRVLAVSEELRSIDIMVLDGSRFRIIASQIPSNVGQYTDTINNVIAWHDDRAIAHLSKPAAAEVAEHPEFEGKRYWNVVIPLHDVSGAKIGLMNLKMSLAVTDALTTRTLIGSTALLFLTVLLVLGLLLTNMRLFEFAILARKLEEVNAMKDEFVSMASHELRGPVTALKGYVSMFVDGSFGALSAQGQKAVRVVEASIRHLSDLVEDVLDVSRIEQHRLDMKLGPMRIEEVITQSVDEFAIHAEAKKIALRFENGARLPLVYADREKVRQVLVNLLSNAIKYTKQGAVTVTAKADDDLATIKVKDTGIGIAAKDREKLFNKFYRVRGEDTKGTIGTGLGLWITKQLVTLMSGEVFVDSLVGVGTEITFTLPTVASRTKSVLADSRIAQSDSRVKKQKKAT